uniref:Leucine rich immune protein (Coil-less) n=1 Tax=Anopheles coluzzii TaxID=1518534 RepID=A0A8W7PFR5_ANOCL
MKLLLALLLLRTVIKSSGSIKIACDYDYTCTIEQLTTSQQLHDLATYSFGDAGMIKLIDSRVPPEAISSFQPIVNYLILERCRTDQLILPPNCTLQSISLIQTSIHRLEVFHNTQLYYLSVTNSEISSLLPSLYNLTALETVRLWQMHIPVFSFDVLRNMEKLNVIELSYNRIEQLQLSSNATCCRNLSLLDLSFNRLSTIDCALLSSMQALTVLQLSSNVIQELYGSLHLPHLTELDLSNNRIKSIDLCRWQIGSLKGLNVVNNRIEHLFDCLGQLQNLMTFQIAGNALTQLDLAPFTQSRLVLLNFSHNRIEVIRNREALELEAVCVKLKGNPVVRNTTDLC